MTRVCVRLPVGSKVTVSVAMLKSSPSVAVPLSSTSTANVVDAPGRALTVTGTSSVPPVTPSATVAV